MSTMKYIHAIEIHYSLSRFALSPSAENCYLVYSDAVDTGEVIIYDAYNVSQKQKIMAHKSPVLKLNINFQGTYFATCSCKVI